MLLQWHVNAHLKNALLIQSGGTCSSSTQSDDITFTFKSFSRRSYPERPMCLFCCWACQVKSPRLSSFAGAVAESTQGGLGHEKVNINTKG
jgi:hypothetical protein